MLFNSLEFLIFFPTVTGLYFLLPQAWRWSMLLVASCVFYMWFIPQYILVLFVTIAIDYVAALYIEPATGARRRAYLVVSVVSTCAVLFVFKYYNFFNANFAAMASALGLNYPLPALEIILPIGLSFHTFQSLSYVIEVYRGKQPAERHAGIYALYVMFFPQLVAGPIERPQNLLGQFRETHRFEYDRVTNGLKLMAWGLFKKVVVADRVAAVVSAIYGTPEGYSGLPLLLATGLFAVQIYCDFSGYSDMAIGAAQVLGFRLMVNFRRPYAARSIPEFWQRWHISLSTWFRDYVFLPLAYKLSAVTTADRVFGVDVTTWAYVGATGVTMVVAGLWHGANWTFIIWGAMLGAFLIAGALTRGLRKRVVRAVRLARVPRLHSAARLAFTFSAVCLAWVFFRAETTSDALLILERIARFAGETLSGVAAFDAGSVRAALQSAEWRYIGATRAGLLVSLGCVAALFLIEGLSRTGDVVAALNARSRPMQWAFYQAVAWSVFTLGNFGEIDFIYFQF